MPTWKKWQCVESAIRRFNQHKERMLTELWTLVDSGGATTGERSGSTTTNITSMIQLIKAFKKY
ncbi:hypothetical protein KIN20_029491 [Parelaphostrongylus tenuis]|uniref:Uncharacterized protein n=1 Tax=Parelaphostrongylus tenuis TaxID=148309 RepID=A0AAD5R2G8_PARTN|nr:hypothetical protein KIN20_029491 [Parelaphostrongylus tenuis]